MRNTIHLKLEKGLIVGTGKVSKQRLFDAFKRDTFPTGTLQSLIEYFAYQGYWVETDKELSNVILPCKPLSIPFYER